MICDTVDLYGYFSRPRGSAEGGELTRYLHGQIEEAHLQKVRPAMLVIPGGGYGMVSQRESEPVATAYFAAGYNVFVLRYSVAPAHYPTQLTEAGMAMLYLRREAAALNIDGAHVAAVGFSAGGHLCGCISLLWDDPALVSAFGAECGKIRPDASVYAYAVITADAAKYHGGSFRNFCADAVPFEAYSLEKKVRPAAPPAFLWATSDDGAVPVENSVRLYSALHAAGVPAELHIFEHGPHGMSVCGEEAFPSPVEDPAFARAANWLPLSLTFLKAHGFCMHNK